MNSKWIFGIVIILSLQFSWACNCKERLHLNVEDWNKSQNIISAVLKNVSPQVSGSILHFELLKIHKGVFDQTLFSISIDEDTLKHMGEFSPNNDWIIFGDDIVVTENFKMLFRPAQNDDYCPLTRPIRGNDVYIKFVNTMSKMKNAKNKVFYKNNKVFATGSLKKNQAFGVWRYMNEGDADRYWEGRYVNGKKQGKWIKRTLNEANKSIVIKEEIFDNGILTERISYDIYETKQFHETYSKTKNTKVNYNKNTIYTKWIVDKIANNTVIEYYENGQVVRTKTTPGQAF